MAGGRAREEEEDKNEMSSLARGEEEEEKEEEEEEERKEKPWKSQTTGKRNWPHGTSQKLSILESFGSYINSVLLSNSRVKAHKSLLWSSK